VPKVPLRFRIKNVEYLGAEKILYGSLEGARFASKEVLARIPSSAPAVYELDKTYDFSVPEQELRFFDPQTEKRIPPMAFSWQ
jgi:multiple sugar transport system ATP-binding protein